MTRRIPPAAIALVGVALGGCATYGFADRRGPTITEEPIAVQTVDIDASFGTDPSHLTEQLVDALRREGLVNAKWTTANASGGVVRCDVAADDEAFGDAIRVLATARCNLDGEPMTLGSGDAQLTVSQAERTVERGRAIELAASRALAAAAADVAAAVRERSSAAPKGS